MPFSNFLKKLKLFSKKVLTNRSQCVIILEQATDGSHKAGMAKLADARDLKSRDPYRSYRFDPGLRHQFYLIQFDIAG